LRLCPPPCPVFFRPGDSQFFDLGVSMENLRLLFVGPVCSLPLREFRIFFFSVGGFFLVDLVLDDPSQALLCRSALVRRHLVATSPLVSL